MKMSIKEQKETVKNTIKEIESLMDDISINNIDRYPEGDNAYILLREAKDSLASIKLKKVI
jgi:hypothetical protein